MGVTIGGVVLVIDKPDNPLPTHSPVHRDHASSNLKPNRYLSSLRSLLVFFKDFPFGDFNKTNVAF